MFAKTLIREKREREKRENEIRIDVGLLVS
jgi:hypothetical protein